jgi:oxalate decarboxylase/phosphoglucose isomerase-like protein (cupin superfamily)
VIDFGQSTYYNKAYPYDLWVESLGVPIYRGYYVENLRTLELGWWEARQCQTAFFQLMGQEGVSEGRVTEIPPGKSLPPMTLALDEIVYVLEGRGLTTVSAGEGRRARTFEWQKHSLFLIPQNHVRQFSNMQGDRPVRLLHYNYLPMALSIIQDPEFWFSGYAGGGPSPIAGDGEFYSAAKALPEGTTDLAGRRRNLWIGNFFPDMRAWDRLDEHQTRGAGGRSVHIQFPGSQMSCHMSAFPPRTYKKAHRHGPGRVIVIPAGEGYSIMWEEGKEKVVVPWQEASVFVPPQKWFHQHFNIGASPARYLALHPLKQFYGHAEKVEDRRKDQIEYPDEDLWIRARFEEELGNRGITSLMPDDAYRDRSYEFTPAAV